MGLLQTLVHGVNGVCGEDEAESPIRAAETFFQMIHAGVGLAVLGAEAAAAVVSVGHSTHQKSGAQAEQEEQDDGGSSATEMLGGGG